MRLKVNLSGYPSENLKHTIFQLTSAKSNPCGSNCNAMPCRISSINSSNRRNLTAHNDLQSLQKTPISNSRDLSSSIENLKKKEALLTNSFKTIRVLSST